MRKNVFGRRFKRDKNERRALFKSLMSSLVLEERIKTTEQKAKSIKGQIEKLVTKVKKNGDSVQNQLHEYLIPKAIEKLITDTALRFKNRNGGYTRLIRLGKRFDSSSMVLMEWVEGGVQNLESRIQNKEEAKTEKKEPKKKEKEVKKKKPAKKVTKKEKK